MPNAKKITIDAAGRIVVPKDLREKAGLFPGVPLDIQLRDGTLEISPAIQAGRVERRRNFAAIVIPGHVEPMSSEDVDRTAREIREERREWF